MKVYCEMRTGLERGFRGLQLIRRFALDAEAGVPTIQLGAVVVAPVGGKRESGRKVDTNGRRPSVIWQASRLVRG